MFYIQKTIKNGWSRAVLMNFIETGLYESQGKAVNNFDRLLPDVQSDLAKETLKDPYPRLFGAKVGMVIRAIEHVRNAIVLGNRPEKTAHCSSYILQRQK